MDKERIEKAVREIIIGIGENPDREGLLDTPKRVANMYEELFSGLRENAEDHLEIYFQEEKYEELVLVKDIPFCSMCEHHLLPFYGKAHVAYLPKKGKLTGLSKLARTVEEISKRPQLQERLTANIADLILKKLEPYGVVVMIEAEHMCMTIRGVKATGSKTITSAVRGVFATDSKARAEVMSIINSGRQA